MLDEAKLIFELVDHEGLKLKPYQDTVGKWTIGIGRNLDDKGISKKEAYMLLQHDIVEAKKELDKLIPDWETHPDNIQRVLVNMMFNLGPSRLAGFKQMRKALDSRDYLHMAKEMLNSKWAKQVGRRAEYLANLVIEAYEN